MGMGRRRDGEGSLDAFVAVASSHPSSPTLPSRLGSKLRSRCNHWPDL